MQLATQRTCSVPHVLIPTPTALHNTAQGKHERAERVPAPPWVTQPQTLCDEQEATHPNKHRRVATTSSKFADKASMPLGKQ